MKFDWSYFLVGKQDWKQQQVQFTSMQIQLTLHSLFSQIEENLFRLSNYIHQYFTCHICLTALTLSKIQDDSFSAPDFEESATCNLPEGHQEPCTKVCSWSPPESVGGFEPAIFSSWYWPLDSLSNSLLMEDLLLFPWDLGGFGKYQTLSHICVPKFVYT